jgi:aminoglycoside phosphotransferase (APT) family kinase protein
MREVPLPPALLRHIPGCGSGQAPRSVQPLLGGGGAHEVLRIDTAAGRFVLRQRRGALPRTGACPRREQACQRSAAAAGLAPAVIATDPGGSWLLMTFVDGAPWTAANLHDPQCLDRLGERLAQLQALPVPPDLDPLDLPALAAAHAAAGAAPGPCAQLRQAAQRLAPWRAGRPTVIAHGDLCLGNLVGPGPCLVDWEYAQLADPLHDLACLLAYYPQLSRRGTARLRAAAGLAAPALDAPLALYGELFATLNLLWCGSRRLPAGVV